MGSDLKCGKVDNAVLTPLTLSMTVHGNECSILNGLHEACIFVD